MSNIRAMRYGDIPHLIELAREAHGRSRYREFCDFDVNGAKRMLITLLSQQTQGQSLCLVSPHGCFIGSVSPLYATTAFVAMNVFWYVREGAPATTALRLLRGFMAWAAQVDGPLVFRFGASDAITDLAKFDRAMTSMGFRFSGGIYEMETTNGG